MAGTIKIKRSAVQGKTPQIADLELGEFCINTYDGKVFIKKNNGSDSIVEIGAGGSGVSSLNSQTGATQTFAIGTGNSGGSPYWASASNVHTLHLPNATNAIRGMVSNGTQTFGGRKFLLDGATVGDTIGTAGRLHVWSSGSTPAVYAQQSGAATGDLFRAVSSAGTTLFSVSSAGAITTASTLSTTGAITCGGNFILNANSITSTTDINLSPGSTADRVIFNNLGTTGSSANAYFGTNGGLVKSTSSVRYKTDIETLDSSAAETVLSSLRAVRYKSLASEDRQDVKFYGLVAEEVATIEPMLVAWANIPSVDANELVPDGVNYDRLGVLLLPIVQKQMQQIIELSTRLESLEQQLAALT